MKKNILLSSLVFASLFLSINTVQAAPIPSHGGAHNPPHAHKPPMNHGHIQQPPRHHHVHHVRHSGFINPCHCAYCYPLGVGARIYYPIQYGNFGASFHISI